MTQLKKVFEVNWQGFNLRRGAVLAVMLGLLLIVGVLPHERRYFLSAIFGALFWRSPTPAVTTVRGCVRWRSWPEPVRC